MTLRTKIPSMADLRSKLSSYLSGEIDYDDIDEWIGDNCPPLSFEDRQVLDLLAELSLMTCEVTCSGQLRTEQMFRDDVQAILDGKERVAFWDREGAPA